MCRKLVDVTDLGTMATIVGTVFGPPQVASRLVHMFFGRGFSPLRLAALAAFLIALSLAVLVMTAPSTLGAIAFFFVFGFGNGIFSIAAGTLPLALLGSEGYRPLQGKVMSARLVVGAMAPFVFALSLGLTGASTSLVAVAVIGGMAALSFIQIGRLSQPS